MRNNPAVVRVARTTALLVTTAFGRAIERGVERLGDEKGGATLEGVIYRGLPLAWHELQRRLEGSAR